MKDVIELLTHRRRLKQLVKNPESERKIMAMSVEQLGDFLSNMEIVPYSCTWEQVPSINVITGGTLNVSMGSMKKKFEELLSVKLMVPSNSNI